MYSVTRLLVSHSSKFEFEQALTRSQLETLKENRFTSYVLARANIFRCKRDDDYFAIKIMSIPNEEQRDNVMKEISVLKTLNHTNVVGLVDSMINGDDVFAVFEYPDSNLQAYMKNSELFLYQCKNRFLYQILSGIAHLHSRRILHKDLRPDKILVYMKSSITMRIAEYNNGKAYDVPLDCFYSENIGFPSYRAPELLFGNNYSTANDVWSVGCIFAEMHLRRPLFSAGTDLELLNEMFSLLGTPTEEIWPGKTSFLGSIAALEPPKQPKELRSVFPELEPAGVDILSVSYFHNFLLCLLHWSSVYCISVQLNFND
ncbi:hypothetical protein VNO78_06391 [Psophocarpus tetragonolobus]|uniref:cyclin-dependent kinase n=1 Tax=Psophocarpus tetragonolobus TaxID=3891 RepID=A0AAN9T1Z1_PSOTE